MTSHLGDQVRVYPVDAAGSPFASDEETEAQEGWGCGASDGGGTSAMWDPGLGSTSLLCSPWSCPQAAPPPGSLASHAAAPAAEASLLPHCPSNSLIPHPCSCSPPAADPRAPPVLPGPFKVHLSVVESHTRDSPRCWRSPSLTLLPNA